MSMESLLLCTLNVYTGDGKMFHSILWLDVIPAVTFTYGFSRVFQALWDPEDQK